ncbi:glutamate--cysteine ligase catalytic subunit [Nematocida ausubeli]|nr:glutamate--cysteine ligase catalytic subunit [Nematocida ausubeli]
MGLLKESKILTWEETSAHSSEIKRNGISHFIQVYKKQVAPKVKEFLWGEELEQHLIVKVNGNWILLLGSEHLLDSSTCTNTILHPEYAGYMLESTPELPYAPNFKELATLEQTIEGRRLTILQTLQSKFGKDASILFLPCFPLLGTPLAFGTGGMDEHTWVSKWKDAFKNMQPICEAASPVESNIEGTLLEQTLNKAATPSFDITRSEHYPDFAITQHKRFFGFSRNIIKRKRSPICKEFPLACIESTANHAVQATRSSDLADSVVIDSMGQGMGCGCLQITMQSESLEEARRLYDNIGAICPLLLFLTAGTSIVSGKLIKTSSRWDIISASVDCRQDSETEIKKSRYSSIDLYTAEMPEDLEKVYNDISPPLEKTALATLLQEGVDSAMAKHIASLYIRDPILCYEDSTEMDDFENIQSSNWRSMRLKLPKLSSNSQTGWMVETRPMEIQPTSFENAAYSVLVVLFSRMMLSLNANFYLPISKVDENFVAANQPGSILKCLQDYIDAETTQTFWYRENIFSTGMPVVKKGTIKEIFLGTEGYIGILGAIKKYLTEYSPSITSSIAQYLQFIEDRVQGKKTSVATYMRRFVSAHPAYKGDSTISQEISNDLIDKILDITKANSAEYLAI